MQSWAPQSSGPPLRYSSGARDDIETGIEPGGPAVDRGGTVAKKKSESDGVSGVWGAIRQGVSMIADIGINAIIGNLRAAATGTMEEAQRRGEELLHRALKALAVFFIMVFGLVLAIVGLGGYLSATVPGLGNGLGYIVVGGVLILLGLVIQFFRK